MGAALAAARAMPQRHSVLVQLPHDLPLVKFDAVAIERVLVNLLENVSKYTPPGSTVTVSAQVIDDQLSVSVADNGPGLPIGREEAVFQKFTRGERESVDAGRRLGARPFAARLSSRTTARSPPRRVPAAARLSPLRCRSANRRRRSNLKRRQAMTEPLPVAILIEDERQIRRFVRTALETEGWSVHEAETMRQGLTDARTRRPDLVILDLGLPDGDGVQFLHDFRRWSKVPVIVLSARVDEQDKIAALDAGADDYLTKPFGVGELLARVRATSRRRTSKQGPARMGCSPSATSKSI